ncbi:MAG TPA: glycosyltransferase [Chloroflexia bacterium]|nr:glycosyltransferase [Chloroflexia bacterium]
MQTPTSSRPRLNVVQMIDVTGGGGAEKVLVDLALHLDRSRYNVTVCATRQTRNYQPLLDSAGVPTMVLRRNSRWETYKMAEVVRMLRRERVDVLHTHLFGSNTWGRLLGRLAGVPVIIAHEHWSSRGQNEIWMDRMMYRLSDRILVTSEASKQIVMSSEGIPAHYLSVVYNGVDMDKFAARGDRADVRAELGVAPDAALIGAVGRLTADKGGQDVLIRVVGRVRETCPQVRLVMVGDGPLRPGLEQLTAQLGLTGTVIFTGLRSDVPRLLGALDVFVLPSEREALPVAVLEAMAAGLPLVATRVGGIPEVVEDGATGFLVPPGDVAAMHCVLERLTGDPALAARLGAAGQAHVQAHFTVQQMVRQVERLYDQLAQRKIRAQRGRLRASEGL